MKGATSSTPEVPTITPARTRLNRRPVVDDALLRAGRLLTPGRRFKADIYRVEIDGAPVLVKTFRGKSWLPRLLGRLQIAREHAAYRCLGGVDGVPCLVGRADGITLLLEWIDSEQLGYAADRERRGARVLPKLVETVRQIHARGVVHWDLRSRHNVLVTDDDDVYVVDFAAAVRLRPGGWMHRLLFERLRVIDRSALLKWKEVLRAAPYTDGELAFLRRFRRWRALWFVNHKPSKPRWDDE